MSKEKRRIKKIDRRADRYIKKGADETSVNAMRSKAKETPGSQIATPGQTRRMTRKMQKEYVDQGPLTIPEQKRGGSVTKWTRRNKNYPK